MPFRLRTFLREISTALPRIRALEERSSDQQIELQQFISLVGIKSAVPAIPPKKLQVRVSGAYKAKFFANGRAMIDDMEALLREHGSSLFAANDVLDFGCGCGRVLIPLSLMTDPARLSGTDIDKQAIHWLRTNHPAFRALDVNAAKPPTKYADASFDIVFGISVFTHLPEDLQHAWLGEIARILRPGGLGLFTTHGETFYGELPPEELRELSERGFHYAIGPATEGLPDFYRTSFQTHDYIRRTWAECFEVLDIRKDGLARRQDLVMVRKKT